MNSTRKTVLHVVSVPAFDSHSIAHQHAALKERFHRSAYTDDYTREERMSMRDMLQSLSEKYQAQCGQQLA